MTESLLTDDVARFMQSGISITVASCDMRRVPSLMRAAGCHVSTDRKEVTLFLLPAQSRQLLTDLATSGVVAVVFSEPPTDRTLQLKGRVIGMASASAEDHAIAARQRERFAGFIIPMGFPHDLAYAVHCKERPGMMAVRFAPTDIFEQTPGPRAGTRLPS